MLKKETWFESMLASRAALQEDEAAGTRPMPRVSFHSDVVRGREPARGDFGAGRWRRRDLSLRDGCTGRRVRRGGLDRSASDRRRGKSQLLCSGKFIDLQQGFHTVDCSLRSRVDPPLRIADKEYAHGINIQAPGKIRIKLPKGTVRFEAEIGIDDWVNPDSYRLSQPYYYQPHHFSEPALRHQRDKARTPRQTALFVFT